MVFSVVALFLHFHVKLPLAVFKPFQNGFPSGKFLKIFSVRGIDILQRPFLHLFIIPGPGKRAVLFLNKTVVSILCQVNTHDQRICRAGSCPQGLVFNSLLQLLRCLQKMHPRNIRKDSLHNIHAVRIDQTFHDHTDPHRRPVFSSCLSCVGHSTAAHTQAEYLLFYFFPLVFQNHQKRTIVFFSVLLLRFIAVRFPDSPVDIDDAVRRLRFKLQNTAGYGIIKLHEKTCLPGSFSSRQFSLEFSLLLL